MEGKQNYNTWNFYFSLRISQLQIFFFHGLEMFDKNDGAYVTSN